MDDMTLQDFIDYLSTLPEEIRSKKLWYIDVSYLKHKDKEEDLRPLINEFDQVYFFN